jgi:hypothetical protein
VDSTELNIEARELLVSLAMELQASTLRAEIYETILEGAETNPSVLSRWRATAQRLYNDADLKERFGMKVAPVLDFALRGLSEEDAQELLDRVRRLRRNTQ